MQEPHPPFFLACTKNDTVALAAELGVGALVLGFAGPDERYIVAAMYHVPPSAGTAAAGIHLGGHVVSDLVATVFGAPVPAAVSVPDRE